MVRSKILQVRGTRVTVLVVFFLRVSGAREPLLYLEARIPLFVFFGYLLVVVARRGLRTLGVLCVSTATSRLVQEYSWYQVLLS